MKNKMFMVAGWLCGVWFAQSPILFAQSRSDCLACHTDISLAKESNGKQISLFVDESVLNKSPHRKVVCIACHTGFNADDVPHREKIEAVACETCHQNAPRQHTFHPALATAIDLGQEPGVSCKDCHGTHDVVSPKIPGSKLSMERAGEFCGECHADAKQQFDRSAHGRAFQRVKSAAPNCLRCHRHDITGTDAAHDTLDHKITQEKLCLSCHVDNPDVRSQSLSTAGFIASYEKSVHGSALLKGNPRAANCVDCHGSHDIEQGSESSALVSKKNLPQTCGKCHEGNTREFNQSVHGIALARGVSDAPSCTNCHGEHTIFRHDDPRSSVATSNVSSQCSTCHGSVRLTSKYGIPGNRTETFADSYHGLALKGGSLNVANCASCHGAHNIKPSSDSTSTVHKANLAAACGKCHPGANTQFAVGSVHVAVTAEEEPILYWIATLYIVLIFAVIGGMLFHNLIDFVKKSRRKFKIRQGLISGEPHGHGLYLRMTVSERLQHGALMLSFFVLVVTGFMLRYPEAGWVVMIRNLSAGVFEVRSLLHRVAAIVMGSASLYHLWYILFTRRGQKLVRDLLPRLQDGKDALTMLRYNLGFSNRKPHFGRFGYIEKSEYWALVWGTIVMAVTGVMMWFDNTFIGIFTKLGYDISRTIHFYEAWLATLAIIVWHFYYVIFNPDIYPMNLAWWRGTVTEAEMEEEHPLELEGIRKELLDASYDMEQGSIGDNGKGTAIEHARHV